MKRTQRSVHTYSQTLNFFLLLKVSFFVPWCQCKIHVLGNDNFFFFFPFFSCVFFLRLFLFFTNVQIRQIWNPSALSVKKKKSRILRSSDRAPHSTSVLPSRVLNTAPCRFAFHFQVKCSSSKKNKTKKRHQIALGSFSPLGFEKTKKKE